MMIGEHSTNNRMLEEYQQSFATWFGVERAFAFWKGRVALYAILRALGVGEGDEVILPGYTCVMAANPIKYLGAKPVYVDIEPATYNMDPALIENQLTTRTKVIIVQHTYGYPAAMDAIMEIADRKGLPVVEDCCLAFGSRYKGRTLSARSVLRRIFHSSGTSPIPAVWAAWLSSTAVTWRRKSVRSANGSLVNPAAKKRSCWLGN